VPIPPTSDGLIGSNVLPGFQFRLTDLQRRPTLTEMSEDPVYRAFALPALQAERRARQVEKEARQVAEAQAQAEREARQVAEADAQVMDQVVCWTSLMLSPTYGLLRATG
jgi:hypothetical protein